MKRRDFLKLAGAVSLAGCATAHALQARVVVVGGGFGGATAAKYIRLWDPSIDVVLVERDRVRLLPDLEPGARRLHQHGEITRGYDALRRHGVQVVRDEVSAIDARGKKVRLASGADLAYERLIVSPGIDFNFGEVQGYEAAMQAGRRAARLESRSADHGAAPQLEQMRDGGLHPVHPDGAVPLPAGPYERASMVAAYFKQAKPRSKVLVLDANPDVTSKGACSSAPGAISTPASSSTVAIRAVAVDGNARTVKLELEDERRAERRASHRAADIAQKAGLITTNNRWCDVDWRTMESKAVKGVHDATLSAPAMPKSASMANNHAKIAAAAIVELLNGRKPEPVKIINTCYSFVAEKEAIRVSSVHEWEPNQGTLVAVKGSGGVSAARSEAEATYAWNWARTIWADSLA